MIQWLNSNVNQNLNWQNYFLSETFNYTAEKKKSTL